MATPHAVLPHALEDSAKATAKPSASARSGHVGWLRSGLLLGVTAALSFTILPGTASAVPGDVTDAGQAAQLVADASHQLEVVTEELNEAKVVLERQQAAVVAADEAAAAAQVRLDALDGQIRQLARSAYTGEGLSRLDILLTSDSADDLVHQLGTLDAIAGHTNQQVAEVALAADEADAARKAADAAEAEAQRAVEDIATQQEQLESQIADYQRQYEALSAPQQEAVAQAQGGTEAQVVPSGVVTSSGAVAPSGVVAPSGAAQVAVDTALAQVGDPYVWGAGGPNSFDCSGLTQYAYSAAGVSLPHSSRSQSQMGTPVSVGNLQPGDLLFYYSPTSHVAMYVGNGKMVHASTSGKPVMVVDFNSMSGFTHARRIAG